MAGVVLVWEGPGSLAGVEGPRAARGGPSWSPAAIGESDVNLRTRSRTEPARWNGEGPLASSAYHLTGVSLTLDVRYLHTAGQAMRSQCS